jgi:hypothetical protein
MRLLLSDADFDEISSVIERAVGDIGVIPALFVALMRQRHKRGYPGTLQSHFYYQFSKIS